MKRFFHSFLHLIALLFLGVAFCSCIYESEVPDMEDGDPNTMALFINTLDQSGKVPEYGVAEKVKSLRVIMISDGLIEYNEKINFRNGQYASTIPFYRYERKVVPGEKQFYLFANEESVPQAHISPQNLTVSLPEALKGLTTEQGMSLTDFLNYFQEEISHDDNGPEAGDPVYEPLLKALAPYIWFAPQYEITDSEIYLPYSAYYATDGLNNKIIVEPFEEEKQNFVRLQEPLYLVPIATKFYFTFENHRDNDVTISNIAVNKGANNNFVLGNVGQSDQKKIFRDTQYYWVNWMANVARVLNGFDDDYDDSDKNANYGWITNYGLPITAVHQDYVFLGSGDNPIELNATLDDQDPDIKTYGPFYMPESCYLPPELQGTGLLQRYNLSLEITDEHGEGPGELAHNLTISNITTLFRSTSVEITVRMYGAGTVDIYAEMRDWNVSTAYGMAQ